MGGFVLTFVFGFVLGVTDPTLATLTIVVFSYQLTWLCSFTLRIQNIWHKNSDFVGLAYCRSKHCE